MRARGRGAYPIKFNGSIFNVDAKVKDVSYDADYRRWGGPYWFQNTRLIYWPMLAAGDSDLMQPFFADVGTRSACAAPHEGLFQSRWRILSRRRCISGELTPTRITVGIEKASRRCLGGEHVHPELLHWQSGTAGDGSGLCRLLPEGQAIRAIDCLRPLADSIIVFFDQHYERDSDGRFRLSPSQSLETWQEAVNPLPDVAGLRYVLTRLQRREDPAEQAGANGVEETPAAVA